MPTGSVAGRVRTYGADHSGGGPGHADLVNENAGPVVLTYPASRGQTVVESGPYRFVRHPGYAGSLLIWTGFGVCSGSLPAIGLVASLLGPAYWLRISAEEKLLQQNLPGYIAYSQRTKRLLPGVW